MYNYTRKLYTYICIYLHTYEYVCAVVVFIYVNVYVFVYLVTGINIIYIFAKEKEKPRNIQIQKYKKQTNYEIQWGSFSTVAILNLTTFFNSRNMYRDALAVTLNDRSRLVHTLIKYSL